MQTRLITLLLLSTTGYAAAIAPPTPAPLANKYAPILYEHLPAKEKARCDKYVQELTLIEKRKAMGTKPWDIEKMAVRQKQIDTDYDKYCLGLRKEF